MTRTQLVQSIRKRLGIQTLRDEQGVTLTEVVIVTAILSIVMTFVTAGFVSMAAAEPLLAVAVGLALPGGRE